MTALSITSLDRELLNPDELDRLESILDFHPEDNHPLPHEWPYEYPPGYAEPIGGNGSVTVDEHLRGKP